MGVQSERLHRIWRGMKNRCFNPKSDNFHRYGGRGITICNEWLSYQPFREWALSNGYADDLFIDRIDNDGNYCPENCRWVDFITQSNNRSTNLMLTMDGKTQSVAEWAREYEMNRTVLWLRLFRYGWDMRRALVTPVVNHKNPDGPMALTYQGRTQTALEWSKEVGIKSSTICKRKKLGWDDERALTTPVRGSKNQAETA